MAEKGEITNKIFEICRIVHLDLKGAPFKVPYLEKVIQTLKLWGATGVLIEWEDTFPYSSELTVIGSLGGSGGDGLYTTKEIQHLLNFVRDNGLEPIQLVQTIGHMEYVLKHPQFQGLREEPNSPAVLCPSKPESQVLVRAMVEQILEIHTDANYLHIGADEVWDMGVCADCKLRATSNPSKAATIYLDHIKELALFIKETRPDITILMWDDMLRSISLDILKEYNLGGLVQPVLWHYAPLECFQTDPQLWEVFRQAFPTVWTASAFKGANGSCQILAPVHRYISNNQAWLQEIKKYSDKVDFAGIIITGWSRYDHYATLCELLPSAMPSLYHCLKVFTKPDDELLEITEIPSEQWPGEQLARNIENFTYTRDTALTFMHGDVVVGWMNQWQLRNNYTNPIQVKGVVINAENLLSDLTIQQNDIHAKLLEITGVRSSTEWIETYMTPLIKQLSELKNTAEARCRVSAGIRPDMVLDGEVK